MTTIEAAKYHQTMIRPVAFHNIDHTNRLVNQLLVSYIYLTTDHPINQRLIGSLLIQISIIALAQAASRPNPTHSTHR